MTESITKHPDKLLRIAFVFNKGRLSRLPVARRGDAPKEFFFGALELEQKGHDIGYFEVDAGWPPGVIGGMVNSLLQEYIPEKTYGNLLIQVWKILKKINNYDCVIGTTSGIAFALGIWRKLGFLRVPIVAIHCGLLNNQYNTVRRQFTTTLLRCMHTMLYGEGEREPLINLCPGIGNRLTVNQFGVDTDFWHPGGKRGNYILSIGNDGRRDFDILIDAAESIPHQIKVITSRPLPDRMPDNVSVLRGRWHSETISDSDIRLLYQEALCVVVTLKESYQPSGQSVCLQAMACGSPVVLTRTEGLWSSSMMRDQHNVLFVIPCNRQDLIAKINLVCHDESLREKIAAEGRETVSNMATTRAFAETIEACCLTEVGVRGQASGK